MNSLRRLPLHMLLLAGLAAPASAADAPAEPATAAKPAAPAENLQSYAGVNVLPLTPGFRDAELRMELPEGVGIVVGFVDPAGPGAGKLAEKDVLTRLDDQVLVNAEQFRTLVRNRKPGQAVKLVRVRGDEVETVELTLAGRAAGRPRAVAKAAPAEADPSVSGRARIVINGQEIDPSQMIGGGTITFGAGAPGGQVVIVGPGAQGLPEEVRRQLEDMRSRGLPVPDLEADLSEDAPVPPAAGAIQGRRVTTFSRSFSFGTAGGSSSTFTDDQGTVSVRQDGDRKLATVKDASGQVLFDGEITKPEQLAALADGVRERIALAERPALGFPGAAASRQTEEAPAAGATAGGKAAEGKAADGKAPAKPRRKVDPREGA